jgi:mRNA-degrading endonuclease RelE of RelBE toxin-antitoxin system
MTYRVEFSEDAKRQLGLFTARIRTILVEAIEEHLLHQPTEPTRRRKLLQATPLADWELRVGEYRVFYNVDEEEVLVLIVAIGVKDHNTLLIEGKEYRL